MICSSRVLAHYLFGVINKKAFIRWSLHGLKNCDFVTFQVFNRQVSAAPEFYEMTSNKMKLSTAAVVAGVGYLLMMTTPFAEFLVLDNLIVPGKMADTAKNILVNQSLF